MAGYYNDLIKKTINGYCEGKNVDGKTFTRDVVEYMMLNALKEAECNWYKTKCEWDDIRRKVKLILLDALTEVNNEMKD